MSKWKTFQLFPKADSLPTAPCVYVVYFDDELRYIGQTNGFRNRFSGHAFRYGYDKNIITPWAMVSHKTKITIKARFSERYGDWAMWEIRLIKKLKPPFNTHHKNKRRTENVLA